MTRVIDPVTPSCAGQIELLLPLERAVDVHACGAKAVNLGRMLRAGLPVPPGFVLAARALDEFIAEGGLRATLDRIEQHIASAHPSEALAAEAEVNELFAATPLPATLRAALAQVRQQLAPPLAVRSSAAGEDGAFASYAGLLCSTLGVAGDDALAQALKRTWASRWSSRAAMYGRRLGRASAAVAAIIQCQVQARNAGVLFTRSPFPGREDEMLCEYCSGTAERLVAGAITPAQRSIARSSLTVRDADRTLTEDAIPCEALERLASFALAAERLFGGPQDIEWAIDHSARVWLVQSRPITATAGASTATVVWSNANVNENFPAPISPLLYSVASQGYTHYFRNLGRAFGLSQRRIEQMEPDLRVIIGVHGGRMYYNLSAIHSILRRVPCGDRLVAWFDDFTGARVPVADRPASAEAVRHRSSGRSASDPSGVEPQNGLRRVLELIRIGIKTTWQYAFIERRVAAFEACVDRFAERTAPQRLREKTVAALRDDLRAFVDIRLNRWTNAALADAAAMVCYGLLKTAVERMFPASEDAHLHNSLLKGITGLKSAEPVSELWALTAAVRADRQLRALFTGRDSAWIAAQIAVRPEFADFNARVQRYLERWGFRCSGELMLTVPSFQERPAELLDIVRAYASQQLADPDAQLDAQRASREAITAEALRRARRRRLLAALPWPNAATVLDALRRMTQAAIGLRERARYRQALLYNRLRRVALAAGEKLTQQDILDDPNDIFFLSMGELDELLSGVAMYPAETARLILLRREAHARFAQQTPGDVLFTTLGEYKVVRQSTSIPAQGDCSTSLRGTSVCGGIARGRAKVLTQVAESRTLSAGDILVTRQTDPGWAPVFGAIGGLVLERGGMLSHGAILAREYGIPTVVGIAGAVERIKTGTILEVDGDHGDVRLLA